jgi:hypothetical protein
MEWDKMRQIARSQMEEGILICKCIFYYLSGKIFENFGSKGKRQIA